MILTRRSIVPGCTDFASHDANASVSATASSRKSVNARRRTSLVSSGRVLPFQGFDHEGSATDDEADEEDEEDEAALVDQMESYRSHTSRRRSRRSIRQRTMRNSEISDGEISNPGQEAGWAKSSPSSMSAAVASAMSRRERQCAQSRIEELEHEVESLKADNEELQAKLNRMEDDNQEMSEQIEQQAAAKRFRMQQSDLNGGQASPRATTNNLQDTELAQVNKEKVRLQKIIDILQHRVDERQKEEEKHLTMQQTLKMQMKAAEARLQTAKKDAARKEQEILYWKEETRKRDAMATDLREHCDELRLHMDSLVLDLKRLEEELESERMTKTKEAPLVSVGRFSVALGQAEESPWAALDKHEEVARVERLVTLSEELEFGAKSSTSGGSNSGHSDSEPEAVPERRRLEAELSNMRHEMEVLRRKASEMDEAEAKVIALQEELAQHRHAVAEAHRLRAERLQKAQKGGDAWKSQSARVWTLLKSARTEVKQAVVKMEPDKCATAAR